MNQDRSMKFRLGLFVLGAAVLLGILIALFGQMPAFFRPQLKYTVRLPQAPGVEEGTPVRKSGVKIGEVTKFDLNLDTGEVDVHIRVDRRYQLRKGDQAVLARGLLLGDTAINFLPEGPDRTPADSGFVFKGQLPGDLRQALGKATDLVGIGQETMEQIRVTAKSFNDFIPEMKKTLSEVQVAATNLSKAAESADNLLRMNQDKVTKAIEQLSTAANRAIEMLNEENQRNAQAALKNFRNASDKLDGMMKSAETTMNNFDKVARNADNMITDAHRAVKTVTERIDTVSKNADELIKDGRATMKHLNETLTRGDDAIGEFQMLGKRVNEKLPNLLKSLEDSLGRFSQMSADAGEFVKSLSAGDGALRRLMTDPTLYNNLNEFTAGINRAVNRLDPIMRDLQLFADKVARHPELLGVSGAVSPSSGIKR
jgi:phospholipid/cholesterol/gamma-HCH transport system substrate-binding protein